MGQALHAQITKLRQEHESDLNIDGEDEQADKNSAKKVNAARKISDENDDDDNVSDHFHL